jgi:predicted nucleic acid-binding protein
MPQRITTTTFTGMNEIFLDTGYVLALELSNDQNHRAATRHWQSLRTKLPPIVTTSYVFDEVVTYFNSRGYHAKAVQVGNRLLRSPSVKLVHVDEALFQAGWAYFQQYADKDFSLTDCISFVVMRQFGITTAFAFDKHFTQAGFQKLP